MFNLDLEKTEEPETNTNIRWIIKKAREFQENIYFCFVNYAKAFDCVDHNKLWQILKTQHSENNDHGIQSHPQLGIVFALAPSLHSFWSYFSTDLQ